ncbi:RDD family protein [Flammeovirga sp. SJP92]|uniref:RDD family protein n=1 Tax=Flammeovirga sp. SJP92 TaxID=1775430 RepID=UPI0007876A0C|nr:RDD family protein [Flammeovirga sp. SJP92]KXX72189.1 hypothetical protein AVL50_00905 [Flammeovirga sp. SJP92]
MKTKIEGRKLGFTQLKLLVLTFCICETVFFIEVGSDLNEILIFLFILMPPLCFILLGKKWAKWVASTLLVLNGLFLFFGGVDMGLILLEVIGVINLVIAIAFHTLPSMRCVFDKQYVESSQEKEKSQSENEEFDYPYLSSRIKASAIDGLVMGAVLILILQLFSNGENGLEIFIFFSIITLVYEPILLTLYSATIGQRLMGIIVRNNADFTKRVNLFRAVLRAVTKYTLGWLSFFTINLNNRHRAIHDFVGDSIVLNLKSEEEEKQSEKVILME